MECNFRVTSCCHRGSTPACSFSQSCQQQGHLFKESIIYHRLWRLGKVCRITHVRPHMRGHTWITHVGCIITHDRLAVERTTSFVSQVGFRRRASHEPSTDGEEFGDEGGVSYGGLEALSNGWGHVGPRDTHSTGVSEQGGVMGYLQEGGGREGEAGRGLCLHLLSAGDSHAPLVEAARAIPAGQRANGQVRRVEINVVIGV
jgi:hypothetical protein